MNNISSEKKVCLITGAASGIGFAIAKAFGEQGFAVVIADLSQAAAERAAHTLVTQGMISLALAMDVSDAEQVSAGFQKAVAHFGRLDVLVSNAGLQIISPLVDFQLSDWEKIMAVQVRGSFLTAQAAMRQMKAQKTGGAIVFIGSVHSVEASVNKSAYVTAKHGLVGLMHAIAKEGAVDNIRANLVNPGFVKTPLVEKQIPEQALALGISEEEVIKRVMLGNTVDGEFTTEEDVAQTVLFFANFPSNALTGQSLIVSHGWHMQ